MGLTRKQKDYIKGIIKSSLREKFKKYKPESKHMPFHHRLLGRDRMALYSFIQSLNTTFGTSVFEPVAVALAQNNFKKVYSQFAIGTSISSEAQFAIQEIMNNLTTGKTPNKSIEINKIKRVSRKGKIKKLRTVKVDLYLETENDEIYLFDLKTAKPNISNFKDFKRTLLEWSAILLHENPKAKVNSLLAIPYNPYFPKPYQRWTLKGMLDLDSELKIAEEFWDFLGGEGAYDDLLQCFELAGIEMRKEIDDYFSQFNIN